MLSQLQFFDVEVSKAVVVVVIVVELGQSHSGGQSGLSQSQMIGFSVFFVVHVIVVDDVDVVLLEIVEVVVVWSVVLVVVKRSVVDSIVVNISFGHS